MKARGVFVCSLLCAWASGACSDDRAEDHGVLDLDVTREDAIQGTYQRNGDVFQIAIDTVDGVHHLAMSASTDVVLIAMGASQDASGRVESYYFDWTAMDVATTEELSIHRGLFLDLAAAARDWGEADGASAPAWIVPLIELPGRLVPPPTHMDTEPSDPIVDPTLRDPA